MHRDALLGKRGGVQNAPPLVFGLISIWTSISVNNLGIYIFNVVFAIWAIYGSQQPEERLFSFWVISSNALITRW